MLKISIHSCCFLAVENPGSDNLKSSSVIPPPTVTDRVLKELFHEGNPLSKNIFLFCRFLSSCFPFCWSFLSSVDIFNNMTDYRSTALSYVLSLFSELVSTSMQFSHEKTFYRPEHLICSVPCSVAALLSIPRFMRL